MRSHHMILCAVLLSACSDDSGVNPTASTAVTTIITTTVNTTVTSETSASTTDPTTGVDSSTSAPGTTDETSSTTAPMSSTSTTDPDTTSDGSTSTGTSWENGCLPPPDDPRDPNDMPYLCVNAPSMGYCEYIAKACTDHEIKQSPYCDIVNEKCRNGEDTCSTCFYLANTCAQIGTGCADLMDECACVAAGLGTVDENA